MKRVMIFGTFDGIHAGHRDMFAQARRYGDFLMGVLARDVTVQKVKGRSPTYTEDIRYGLLYGEPDIDQVVLGDARDMYAVLRKHPPDVICLGYDQEKFVKGLGEHFSGRVERLSSYEPHRFKSSKIEKMSQEEAIRQAKRYLRKRLLDKRGEISAESRLRYSQIIASNIASLPEVQTARAIGLYRSMASEVDTKEVFEYLFDRGKTVLVPCDERDGHMCRVTPETSYTKTTQGFEAPQNPIVYEGTVDVCIAPLVGFDARGKRLGMGGGYYDRFFQKHPEAVAVGVGFAVQEIARVPFEAHDQKMRYIVTEKEKFALPKNA